jgi:hypothetical protein
VDANEGGLGIEHDWGQRDVVGGNNNGGGGNEAQ